MTWVLPDSPDDPRYAEVMRRATTLGGVEGLALVRAVAEADFWFFCRFVSSMRDYFLQRPDHPLYGIRWIEHPWMFDRCREIQKHIEEHVDGVFYNWPRYHHKTTVRTILATIWETLRDPTMTTAVLTFKTDKTGEAMFEGFRKELKENPLYHELWPEIVPKHPEAELADWTKVTITLNRPPGVREPTISIHSLGAMPVSFHVRRLLVDDAEVKETVSSMEVIAGTVKNMRDIVALCQDNTLQATIGTVWDENGPMLTLWKDGYFSERDHWTCYGRPDEMNEGIPCLLSQSQIDEWESKMDPYAFSCHMLGMPTAKHEQEFKDDWLKFYRTEPRVEKSGKNVYLFADFAGEGVDATVFFVAGLGSDRNIYALDMWREFYGFDEAIDLLFRVVQLWEPRRSFVEEFGMSTIVPAIKREMEAKSYRFEIDHLPKIKRRKTDRIRVSQGAFSSGKIYLPQDGFGHASRRRSDDVMKQFLDEEYRRWSPIKGSTTTDDMLDAVAWSVQPETLSLLEFPRTAAESDPFSLENRRKAASNVINQVSGWAF